MRQRLGVALLGALAAAVLAVPASVLAVPAAADAQVRTVDEVVTVPGGPTATGPVRLRTTLYLPAGGGRHPAVIVSPGFGQTRAGVADDARDLARRGYVALAWTMRGFDPLHADGGRAALDAPDTEGADLRVLVDRLAARPDVLLDGPGDPRVGLTGRSYGGGASLLGAALDRRVDAIVPVITWSSLQSALLPGGVFKAQYAAVFLAGASSSGCLRFAQRVCDAYTRLAQTGTATAADLALLRGPGLDRVTAPTLLVQGEDDTLFPLGESLRTARVLQGRGVPVQVAWLAGGHDRPFGDAGEARIRDLTARWFDRWLRRDPKVRTGPLLRWDRDQGAGGTADRLPPEAGGRTVALRGSGEQVLANPPGGRPTAISSVPGAAALLGPLAGRAAGFGASTTLDVPGQTASWETAPLRTTQELLGGGSLRVRVRSSTGEAVLFAKVYDVKPGGGSTLPGGLVAPIRVTGVGGAGREVTVPLPVVAHVVPGGNSLRVVLATTDLGYAGPTAPASYQVALDPATALALPLQPLTGDHGYARLALTAGLIALGLALVALLVWLRRRRHPADLGDDDVPPVVITGLAKSYASGVRAVDGIDLVVERGQVLGLLGPNGAGKTTALRMLAGLITPSAGEVRLFGRPVTSGAPVLERVGLFIEGPGLLPHLSGLDNLRLYWTSTARSMDGSYVEEALEIAGLGDAVRRPVRTYSQGMRQRLAIAQAMLGRPDLLVLDEPTNGLDPPQIKEVREVLQRIAATGRTVLVSSHLLSEVEQTCSHVAVMSRGRMVAQGPVSELLADEGTVHVEVPAGDRARAEALVADLAGIRSVRQDGAALVVVLDGVSRADVVAALVRADVDVLGVTSRRRLEDVFLELTGTAR